MKLKVTSIIEKPDSSGNLFRTVTFEELSKTEEGIINLDPKKATRNFWQDSYPAVFDLEENKTVYGRIVTRKVFPYKPFGSKDYRNTYSTIVLGKFDNQEELEIAVKATFNKIGIKLFSKPVQLALK